MFTVSIQDLHVPSTNLSDNQNGVYSTGIKLLCHLQTFIIMEICNSALKK
jgi:hypothetical protein